MHRRALLDALGGYLRLHPDEAATVARVRALVEARPDCFERSCLPGHVTASCWILAHDRSRCLLTHHRKLGRWLQLGGHVDGEHDALAAALREAREESGLREFALIEPAPRVAGVSLPLDVDVHTIPARGGEPEHEHHDLRFLLVAAPGQALVRSDESTDLAWFAPEQLAGLGGDESVLRLARKAAALRTAAATPLGR